MKCKICGKRFNPKKELKYTVVKKPVGVGVLTESTKIYECFDCPKCGCQNMVNIRKE